MAGMRAVVIAGSILDGGPENRSCGSNERLRAKKVESENYWWKKLATQTWKWKSQVEFWSRRQTNEAQLSCVAPTIIKNGEKVRKTEGFKKIKKAISKTDFRFLYFSMQAFLRHGRHHLLGNTVWSPNRHTFSYYYIAEDSSQQMISDYRLIRNPLSVVNARYSSFP